MTLPQPSSAVHRRWDRLGTRKFLMNFPWSAPTKPELNAGLLHSLARTSANVSGV